jgi:CRP-like cAMP-binding protein
MFIQEIDLLKGMSQETMNEIANMATEKLYERDGVIFQEGDSAQYFYILEEGTVRLTIGEQAHITFILSDPGEAFGWSSLADRDAYTASATCLSPCKLIRIEKGQLDRIFEKAPASGVTFFKNLVGIVGQRWINSYNALLATPR